MLFLPNEFSLSYCGVLHSERKWHSQIMVTTKGEVAVRRFAGELFILLLFCSLLQPQHEAPRRQLQESAVPRRSPYLTMNNWRRVKFVVVLSPRCKGRERSSGRTCLAENDVHIIKPKPYYAKLEAKWKAGHRGSQQSARRSFRGRTGRSDVVAMTEGPEFRVARRAAVKQNYTTAGQYFSKIPTPCLESISDEIWGRWLIRLFL